MNLEHDYYVRLIPSHNRKKPLFVDTVRAMTAGPWYVRRSMKGWDLHFQLETAIGDQLDILGEWIGISRFLQIQLDGIFFTWDDVPATGWDSGAWQGRFDDASNWAAMGDEDYRRLLYTMIMLNQWDGTFAALQEIWERFLPVGRTGFIQDNQDMSLSLGYLGAELTGIQAALAEVGATLVKPMAVRIRELMSPPGGLELLTWDAGPYFFVDGVWYQSLLGMGYWCDHAILHDDDVLAEGPAPFTGWLYGSFPLIHTL